LTDKAEILGSIRARTNFATAVLVGILAWLLSIGITILIVYSAPGWVRNLTDRIDQVQHPTRHILRIAAAEVRLASAKLSRWLDRSVGVEDASQPILPDQP